MLNDEQKVEPTSENGNSTKPPVSGQSEQFYCADWNRCGSLCEEQCNACNKAENMPEVAQ